MSATFQEVHVVPLPFTDTSHAHDQDPATLPLVSYRFEQPHRLALEIRRVAIERLDHALDQLSVERLREDPADAVHTARKDLKKTRSLLRLVRERLGSDVYRAENDRLRDAAHLLAGAREADAMAEALRELIERVEGSLSAEALSGARAWMASMPGGSSPRHDVVSAATGAVMLIGRARDDARLWALGYGSFELIGPGVLRTYRQGRRGLTAAASDPSDETVHEWRKRVKDMWYSLRLLNEVWEPVIRPFADQAHELSELLGDHHDMGEVRIAIEAGESALPVKSQAEILGHVAARQAELHEAAISLGMRLYAERPRRYVERLEGLWNAWEADAPQQVGHDGLPGS